MMGGDILEAAEADLIRSARRGDSNAFGQLVARHQLAAFNIAYRLTGSRQEAQDVAQEAFIKTHQALDRFDLQRPFAPWFTRIVTNTALNLIKQRRPATAMDEEMELSDPAPSPEEAAIIDETAGRLRSAIAALPLHYRAAIELRHFQGLSYQEMSEALDAPLSDVKSWLFRARRRLRETLAEGDG